MADFMQTMTDRLFEAPKVEPVIDATAASDRSFLPATAWVALLRGLRGQCPRCGEARLFARFLQPTPMCLHCQQDWTHQQADDFPAYVSIFVTGHLMAPMIMSLSRDTALSPQAMLAIILPTALFLVLITLQPAKGAVIAMQWWHGIHGFEKERREAFADKPNT